MKLHGAAEVAAGLAACEAGIDKLQRKAEGVVGLAAGLKARIGADEANTIGAKVAVLRGASIDLQRRLSHIAQKLDGQATSSVEQGGEGLLGAASAGIENLLRASAMLDRIERILG
jgi:hypothetical protein